MNQPAISENANPFGKQVTQAANNAVANSDAERAIQEVQAALVIAKKFPRSSIEAMDRILNACTRPTLANTALYSYPRGGQEVTGPSIRLAEALAQEWGNIQFGFRELSAVGGVSTVEAFAWDVQSNTKQVKTFQVSHTRHTRQGSKQLTDPRDIYEMVANQAARRVRACILGVIPGDVVESAVNQCEVTQQNSVEVTPESIKKMIGAFEENYNVTQEHIEKRLGKRADAINAMQMLSLRKIFQSLKDGMSKPADWFEIVEIETPEQKTSDVASMVKDKKVPAENPEEVAEPSMLAKFNELLLETKDAEHAEALKNGTIYKKLSAEDKKLADKSIEARLQAFEVTKE